MITLYKENIDSLPVLAAYKTMESEKRPTDIVMSCGGKDVIVGELAHKWVCKL